MARDHCSDCRRVDHIYVACCSSGIFLNPGRMPTPRAGRRRDRTGNAKAAPIVAAAKAATIVAAAKAATTVAAAKAAVAAAKAAYGLGTVAPPPYSVAAAKAAVAAAKAARAAVAAAKAALPASSGSGLPVLAKALPRGKGSVARFMPVPKAGTPWSASGIPPASSVPSQAGPAPSQDGPACAFVMAPEVLRDRSSSIEFPDDSSSSSSGRGSQWSNLSTAFATHDEERDWTTSRIAAQSPRGLRWRRLEDNYDGSTTVYSSSSPDVDVYESPEGPPQVFCPEGPPLAATAAAPPAATAAAPPATKGPPPAAKAPPPADGPEGLLVGQFRPELRHGLGGHVIDIGNHVTLGALLPPLASPFAIVRRKRWREAQTAKVSPHAEGLTAKVAQPGQSNLMMALAPPPPPPPPPPYKAGT